MSMLPTAAVAASDSPPSSPLLALPTGLLEHVLQGCDARSLARVGAVCRGLRHAVAASALWAEQLALLGLSPPPATHQPGALRDLVALHGGHLRGGVGARRATSWGLAEASEVDRGYFRPAPLERRFGVLVNRSFFALTPDITVAWRCGRDFRGGVVSVWGTRSGQHMGDDGRVPVSLGDNVLVAGDRTWGLMTARDPWQAQDCPAQLLAFAAGGADAAEGGASRVRVLPRPPSRRRGERLVAARQERLLLAERGGDLRLWDAREGAPVATYASAPWADVEADEEGASASASSGAQGQDGGRSRGDWLAGDVDARWAAALRDDGVLAVWRASGGPPEHQARAPALGAAARLPLSEPRLHIAGHQVWLFGHTSVPAAYDLRTARWTTRLVGHRDRVNSLAVAGALVATGSDDGSVALWRLPEGLPLCLVDQARASLPPTTPSWHRHHGFMVALSDALLASVPAGALRSHALWDHGVVDLDPPGHWMHTLGDGTSVYTSGLREMMRVPAGAAPDPAVRADIAAFWRPAMAARTEVVEPLHVVSLAAGTLVTFSPNQLTFSRWQLHLHGATRAPHRARPRPPPVPAGECRPTGGAGSGAPTAWLRAGPETPDRASLLPGGQMQGANAANIWRCWPIEQGRRWPSGRRLATGGVLGPALKSRPPG